MELVTAAQEALRTLTEEYERKRSALDDTYRQDSERIRQALDTLAPFLNGSEPERVPEHVPRKYARRTSPDVLRDRVHGYLGRYGDFTVPELEAQLDLTTGGIHGVLAEMMSAGYVEPTGEKALGRGCRSNRPANQYRTTDKWIERCTDPKVEP